MTSLLGTQSMQTCRMREPLKRKEPGHIDEIQPLEREHKMVVNIIHKWVGIFFEGKVLVSCTPNENREVLVYDHFAGDNFCLKFITFNSIRQIWIS